MHRSVSCSIDARFAASFIAVRYFLGVREDLESPLPGRNEAALELLAELSNPDRGMRARSLARELAKLSFSCKARSLA